MWILGAYCFIANMKLKEDVLAQQVATFGSSQLLSTAVRTIFVLILTLFIVLGYSYRHPESNPFLPPAIWESNVRPNVPQLLPVNIANS